MWRLTAAASDDLDRISLWSLTKFGLSQAEKYDQLLVNMFDHLAANPEMASERRGSKRLVRLMPCEAHHILYVIEDGNNIIILRVLHHLQDWFDLL